ncbi:MAG: glycerophosphodiester phosphodiesterase [Rhodoglobus sp.]
MRPSDAASAYLSPAGPRVFAHRGLAVDAPENTLLAFARAVAAGVSYIETDVHASADGIAVIAHDPDLTRVAGSDRRVDQLTLAELEKIDLGHGQAFCPLARALDAFPGTRFNIDVKSADAVSPTIASVLSVGATKRVLVTSFDERRRAAVVRGLPGVASSASARRLAPALLATRLGVTPAARLALRGLVAVQVPEKAAGIAIATPAMIRNFHAAGVEVHVWTVNEPARMRELLDLGVDGIITDRADLALEVVLQRS